MELSGEHRITASRAVVWEALHDTALLKDCIKGCKRLETTDAPNRMSATVEAKVGPVKATFDADVEIINQVAPESYTLTGDGRGGVAGFAKGSADVHLAEDGPDATILTYKADAKIGGKLAQLGSRLVDTTAKKYAAEFFEAFSARLNSPVAAETATLQPAHAAMPGPAVADAAWGSADAGTGDAATVAADGAVAAAASAATAPGAPAAARAPIGEARPRPTTTTSPAPSAVSAPAPSRSGWTTPVLIVVVAAAIGAVIYFTT